MRQLFALDLRSIALFRVGLGLTLLLDLATRALDLRAHYTDRGVLPRSAYFRLFPDDASWSLHNATGSALGASALFVVAAAAAIALVIGWRARTAAAVSLVLLVSLQARNPAVLYGADLFLRTSLLWACLLPLAARFSVSSASTTTPDAHLSAATVALTLQTALLFVAAGLEKLGEDAWRNQLAVFYALTTDAVTTPLARPLAEHVDVTRALTVAILLLQLVGPALLFVPIARDRVRLALVAAFALFYLAMALFFSLGLLPLAAVVAWLPFVPSTLWRAPAVPGFDVERAAPRAALAVALLVVIAGLYVDALPAPVAQLGRALHLDQRPSLYAGRTPDGWFVAAAPLADGHTVDVLAGGAPLDFERATTTGAERMDMRSRRLLLRLVRVQAYRRPYLAYLCRSEPRARSVDLWFVQDIEEPDGSPARTSKILVGHLDCVPQRHPS